MPLSGLKVNPVTVNLNVTSAQDARRNTRSIPSNHTDARAVFRRFDRDCGLVLILIEGMEPAREFLQQGSHGNRSHGIFRQCRRSILVPRKLRQPLCQELSPARIPAKWDHFAEKDSRQINIPKQTLVTKVFSFGGICSKSR